MNAKRIIKILVLVLYLLAILLSTQPVFATGGTDPVLVNKTAVTTFSRHYRWTIEKGADVSSVTLSTGQVFTVNYWVTVTATPIDSDWAVSGNVYFGKTVPDEVIVTQVEDQISGGITPDLTCPPLPLTLAPDWVYSCSYSTALPDGSSRTNTGTVTSNVGVFSDFAAVTFGTPKTVTDECITVTDSKAGTLGTVCAGDAPKTFKYTVNIGPYNTCGQYQVKNTATFTTNDTKTTGSASWTIDVDVPCTGGCTLTPGYWKTHSRYGPAPYDSTWALIGENTPFYLSGKTWYQTLWTSPQGNAYYILSFQYIAARLNILNGASAPSSVQSALSTAEALFFTYTPAQIGALSGTQAPRPTFISLATTLANYNTGLIGPGHCSE